MLFLNVVFLSFFLFAFFMRMGVLRNILISVGVWGVQRWAKLIPHHVPSH